MWICSFSKSILLNQAINYSYLMFQLEYLVYGLANGESSGEL